MKPSARPKPVLLALACLLAGFGLYACGGSDSGSPVETVEAFADAILAEDGAKACELVSSETREELEAISEGGCEDVFSLAFGEVTDEDREDAENTTYELESEEGDSATVTATVEGDEPDSIDLVKEDGEWRITDIE